MPAQHRTNAVLPQAGRPGISPLTRGLAWVLVLAAALLFLLPGVAIAAAALEYQIQYTVVTESGLSQMIVTVVADPEASLPATVSVPVPAGSKLLWSGELLGGDVSADPRRDAAVARVGAMDVYTFLLEQGRLGQVEASVAAPTVEGNLVKSSFAWTNPGEAAPVSVSVVVEPGAQDVRINGKEPEDKPQLNDAGESLYLVGSQTMTTGDSLTVSTAWSRGGGGGPSALLPVVGGLLVLAVVALILVIVRERHRRSGGLPPQVS